MTTLGTLVIAGLVLPSTNQALDSLRRAGFTQGYRAALVKARVWSQTVGQSGDEYVSAARRARTVAAAMGRTLRGRGAGGGVRLHFVFHGYDRWDHAGGYLPAKWIEDGLVDAGVFRSDRFDVESCRVRVCRGECGMDHGGRKLVAIRLELVRPQVVALPLERRRTEGVVRDAAE